VGTILGGGAKRRMDGGPNSKVKTQKRIGCAACYRVGRGVRELGTRIQGCRVSESRSVPTKRPLIGVGEEGPLRTGRKEWKGIFTDRRWSAKVVGGKNGREAAGVTSYEKGRESPLWVKL